ncbi:hypothetical protein AB0424_01315 [Streptomyces sp. NPDC051180]|uniref:hypothetical protein n=1 Tax=Streptomyces sp. NPDC051180 TaxID=3155797 RepID=UPI00344EA590
MAEVRRAAAGRPDAHRWRIEEAAAPARAAAQTPRAWRGPAMEPFDRLVRTDTATQVTA